MSKRAVGPVAMGLVCVLGVIVCVLCPFSPELTAKGHMAMGAFIVTLGLWIIKPCGISFSASGLGFLAFLLAIGIAPVTVFSGFTSNAIWSLIPALFFGHVLSSTGFGRRIAYFGLMRARLTWGGIMLMWVVIGLALSLLTPSISVRVVIVTPIAISCVELCGLAYGTRGRSLILLTAWSMAVIPGTGWLTGSLNGPLIAGLFSAVSGLGELTFGDWLSACLVPTAVLTCFTLIAGYFALKPGKPLSLSADVFKAEYKKLPKMSRNEILSGIILAASFAMFATNSLHGIPDVATCLMAFFLLSILGIIKGSDISGGISWDLVLFIGVSMSLGAIFSATGISSLLSGFLVPALEPIAGSPWIFSFSVLATLLIWRFADIAFLVPTISILTSILPDVSAAYGINPLVWIPIMLMASNCFFLIYQNMFALTADTVMKSEGWSREHFSRYGLVYGAGCFAALFAAIPWWISRGYF